MAKIAGVVITYFPNFSNLIYNIDSYIDHIDRLFIIFNSPISTGELKRLELKYSKIQVISNEENIGIASALNLAATRAQGQGYDWLLTMDQDSYFQTDLFFKAFKKSNFENVAIFSPTPVSLSDILFGNPDEVEQILCVITSGNLLNLEIWKTIGGFEEKLFIDEVDNDFCLKAVSNRFKVIRFTNIPLIHALGQNKEVSFLFKKYTIITHPPIRAYYIFRNNLFIFKKYKKLFPEFVRSRKIMLLKVLVKILLFSDKRVQNSHYIYSGIKDYFKDSYGSYKGKKHEAISG